MATSELCPCGSNTQFDRCCGPLLEGSTSAPTAVALMRSRYCAFVTHNADYLLQTWHPDTRPAQIEFHPRQHWLGLKVKQTEAGSSADQTGSVEFVARYKIDGAGHRLHERSRFVWNGDRWLYLDDEQLR